MAVRGLLKVSRRSVLLALPLAAVGLCGPPIDIDRSNPAVPQSTSGLPADSQLTLSQIVARIDQADIERRQKLKSYSAVRRYTLSNQRMSKPAEMTVRAASAPDGGTSFEVLSSNAEGMSGRVLTHVLDGEKDVRQKGNNRITPKNYNFELVGTGVINGRSTYKLRLLPKEKSKYLLEGFAWFDQKDFSPVHVEGKTEANVSFWVGKPNITMDFTKVGDFWMVLRNSSHSQVKFMGASDLVIDYSGYAINGGLPGPISAVVSRPIASPSER